MTTMHDLEDQKSALEYAETCYLQNAGWHHTSSNPIFIWMWEKEWNGRTFMMDRRHALLIQNALERDAR